MMFHSKYQSTARQEETDVWQELPQVLIHRMLQRVEGVLLGKRELIRQMFTALLAGGHVLLEDKPGVGKTVLAEACARVIGGEFKRIQFTSDMLPSDVLGGAVWDAARGELKYVTGPIMGNVVLADEINRASPRTQSALLEAMEERRITVDGETRPLPSPFMLIATQNPLRFEGTSRLPEAQLDRFMMRLSIGYPEPQFEKQLLEQYADGQRQEPHKIRPVLMPEEWLRMQREVQLAHVHPGLIEYMVQVADASRKMPELSLAMSPRAGRDWLRAAQASAYLEGRGYVLPDDLLATGEAVLAHRLEVYPGAPGRMTAAQLVEQLLRATQLPAAVLPKAAGGRR
ncbi:MoxR-like ATPase [Paenibacillus algorifonticola]|uniref:MoxR-like ATPase n=1 Tax=Paenibacillus algorifonticola TaxID=684063 RepID=A0A1I2J2H4_9BACL|nr:MoxR family ATPase [Paenibacillus algorifonticola]SFF48922.1 MoxR-like ATPase [Paenibacillus algorifonticola]